MSRSSVKPWDIARFITRGTLISDDLDDLDDLVNKLLKCDAVTDEQKRWLTVEQLEDFGDKIRRYPSPREDVVSILRTCLNYRDGLYKWVGRVGFFEEDSLPLRVVINKLWEIAFPGLSVILSRNNNPALRHSLLELLVSVLDANLSVVDLRALYDEMALGTPLRETDTTDILSWLHLLGDLTPQADRFHYPVVEFAARIGYKSPGIVGEEITGKARGVASILEGEEGVLSLNHALSTVYSHPSVKWPYLLIVIQPSVYEKDKFTLRAWLWGEGDNEQERIDDFDQDHERNLQEIETEISQLILRQEDRYGPDLATPLKVEIFLPYDLLSSAVDEWPLQRSMELQGKIGAYCQVVVRSQERLCQRALIGRWKTKWNKFLQLRRRLDSNSHRLFKHEEIKMVQDVLPAEDIVGCSLGFIPTTDILKATLNGGIPIALWLRGEPLPKFETVDEIHNELLTIFSLSNFDDLPDFVRQNRNKSTDELSTRLWKYVSLLWDDPGRVPHEPSLRMP